MNDDVMVLADSPEAVALLDLLEELEREAADASGQPVACEREESEAPI